MYLRYNFLNSTIVICWCLPDYVVFKTNGQNFFIYKWFFSNFKSADLQYRVNIENRKYLVDLRDLLKLNTSYIPFPRVMLSSASTLDEAATANYGHKNLRCISLDHNSDCKPRKLINSRHKQNFQSFSWILFKFSDTIFSLTRTARYCIFCLCSYITLKNNAKEGLFPSLMNNNVIFESNYWLAVKLSWDLQFVSSQLCI